VSIISLILVRRGDHLLPSKMATTKGEIDEFHCCGFVMKRQASTRRTTVTG